MKLLSITSSMEGRGNLEERVNSKNNRVNFLGKRTDRNVVSQLAKENRYSLTEPNQRYIAQSIENLGKVPGEGNIKFLLETAAKNKYSTNIKLQDMPKNNWKAKLLLAAASAIALTPFVSDKIKSKLERLAKPKNLTAEEKEIMDLREQLLAVVDLEQINNEMLGASSKNFKKNLDYFIVSSETTLKDKKYVLERLNYFMSDSYKINPQLEGKKSIAVAEMINDMAINVPGNKAPNIKSVNQKQHGMCAAISIVRKKLAYEDKPNYVDSLISELDASDVMKVYDRNNLGSGKRVSIQKIPLDFKTALANGYRIIDAAALYWMQIADMSGANKISYSQYSPFDTANFDVKQDSFYHVHFADEDLAKAQTYYQALDKAESVISDYKAKLIKQKLNNNNVRINNLSNIAFISRITKALKDSLSKLLPDLSTQEVQKLINALLRLEKSNSEKINPKNEFEYIPNEEDIMKMKKIGSYISSKYSINDISEKQLQNVLSLIEDYHKTVQENRIMKDTKISKAQDLYDIASAFRYQMIASLEDKRSLKNAMLEEKIPNKETLILQTIDKLIEKLENNSPDSDLIISQLGTEGTTSEKMLAGLYEMKAAVTTLLTEGLDSIYQSLIIGSRQYALIGDLESIQNSIENYTVAESFAKLFNISKSPKKVSKKVDELIDKLRNGSEKDYIEIFQKFGNTSQIEYLKETFRTFTEACAQENNGQIVSAFLNINGLKVEDGEQAFVAKLQEIENSITTIEEYLNNLTETLKILDENGDVLISASPKDVIMKKLENRGVVEKASSLREIQEHFAKIAKVRSQDEFSSRRGKLKDKTLLEFSKTENGVLKRTEKSYNSMYAYVKKQLNYLKSDLKDSLGELKRIIGVHNGEYWVGKEGHSGLCSMQQIRVLEYMTDRPHYETADLKKAINIIKKSPYSGISTSSVFHDKSGWHAQYISDIAPVKVKENGKDGVVREVEKDVLFHDNTWGAVEMENTWIDSNGLKRTDYSDSRGGTLGYITDDNYRNGNFVERILSDMILRLSPDRTDNKIYKKLKHPREASYETPQYNGVILDGKSPKMKQAADKIHDALFVPNTSLLTKFEKTLSKMTEDEVKAKIKSLDNSGISWKTTYEQIKNRIFPIVGDGIQSKAEYDKLSDDDYLKVLMEKIALKNRYQVAGLEPEIAKVKNVKDLAKFSGAQKTRALNSFKHAFSKTLNNMDYLIDVFDQEVDDKVEEILAKHNVKLNEDDLFSIGEKLKINKDKYDGSLKTSIDMYVKSLSKDIDAVVQDKEARIDLKKYFRKLLNDKLYFNTSDLKNPKITHIIEFIDREFDPTSDEEFVKIYRQIQDMTEDEFKSQILSKVTLKDLGFKEETGYDVLKRIQRYDEAANNSLVNTVYYDSLVKEIDDKPNKPIYTYKKLTRTPKHKMVYDFDTLYTGFKNDLSLLTLPKLFNKYKDRNIRNYGAYPAYPRLDYMVGDVLDTSYNYMIEVLEKNINSVKAIDNQIENYNISHKLTNYIKKAQEQDIPSDYQYKNLNLLLGKLITINYDDESNNEVVEAAGELMELPKGTSWKEYIPKLELITMRLTDFENTTSKSILQKAKDGDKSIMNESKKAFVYSFVQPKYRDKVLAVVNDLETAMIHQDDEKIETLKQKLYDYFVTYHVLSDPEELLKLYMQTGTSDSEYKGYNNAYKTLLSRTLSYAKLAEVQEILMEAVSDGLEINVSKLFDNYNLEIYGEDVAMSSGSAIYYMVNSLVIDKQSETALMFLDKLALQDKYVEYTAETADWDKLKEMIGNASQIAQNFIGFQNALEPVFNQVMEELKRDDVNIVKLCNKLKSIILNLGKTYNQDKKDIKMFLASIDTIKETCIQNENAQKDIIFATFLNSAKAKIANQITAKISEINSVLDSHTTILNLINTLMLDVNSDAYKKREEMNAKFTELIEYRKSFGGLQNDEYELEDEE